MEVPIDALTRRSTLRLLALSALAVAAAAPLAACGSEPGTPASGGDPGADGIEPVAADIPRAAGDADAVPDVVAALQRSGGALFGRLGEEPGNLAISPTRS